MVRRESVTKLRRNHTRNQQRDNGLPSNRTAQIKIAEEMTRLTTIRQMEILRKQRGMNDAKIRSENELSIQDQLHRL